MTGTVIRGDLEAQGLDAGHMYYVDGSRSDAYTETGSYLQPYKTVQAAFTAIETAAQAHIDASDMANSRFKLHIGAGTYNETMTLYGKARYLAIIGDGVTLDGTIALTTSEQSEVPGGSGYHYHRYEFIGGEGNRAYRGDCFRINAPITATRNNDSLFYLSFIGTNLMCDIDFPTYGTFVLYMENCYHNDATKSITGTFASSATSYCLLETRGATKLLCTLAGDVCLYDCDGTYFNAINTTPYNQNSRVTDSTFNGSVTIAYVSAKTMSMDSLTYASFVGRTPTVSNLTYSLVDNTVVNVADSSSATCWPCLFEAATGIQGPKTDAALTYNASTGALSATSLAATSAITGASSTLTTAGVAKSITDVLTISNSAHAADMDGTGSGILFNLTEDTGATAVDAGRIVVAAEKDLTSTASSQDTYVAFHTALDGVVSEKARVSSAGYLGVATAAPRCGVDVYGGLIVGDGTATPTGLSVPSVGQTLVFNSSGSNYTLHTANETAATGPGILFRRARGTSSAQAQIQSGDTLFGFFGAGFHNGSNYGANVAVIKAYASETFTTTAQGTHVVIETTPIGSTSRAEAFRVDNQKNMGVGGLTSFGSSAAKVVGISSGTAPTTSPADAVQMWSADRASQAGTAGLNIRSENGKSYIFADACGFGTLTPSTFAEFSHAGTAAATWDAIAITNTVNAASMTATGTGILFNQWYYNAATPAVADASRIASITEGNWTSDANTHDATMSFQVALNGTVTERLTINSAGLLRPTACAGAAQDRALLLGVGTSGDPATWSTADKSAIEFRCKTSATSGTAYGAYIGMEAATAAEHIAQRGRCYLTASTGNAHGGHFTLEDNADAGAITGLGTGMRANWVLGNAAQEAGGTYYGAMAEIYCNGSSSDPSAVTRYACLAIGVGGDSTAAAKVKNAIDFYSAGADATTNMIYTHTHTPGDAAGSIRVLVNGVAKYIKYWDAE